MTGDSGGRGNDDPGRSLIRSLVDRRRNLAVLGPTMLRRFFLWHMLTGSALGIVVLKPLNEILYWLQHDSANSNLGRYLADRLAATFSANGMILLALYGSVGALVGLATGLYYRRSIGRNKQVLQLTMELERDLIPLIARGESNDLEFKSTFRWDLKAGKLNRHLETAVLKSLAGFLNGEGGTLLIGVADGGEIIGLEHDYGTLRRQNRDGFDQALMSAVASRMGTDVCSHIHLVFHGVAGKDVVRVMAEPAGRPVYLAEGNDTSFYLRTGAGTRKLSIPEAIEYIRSRWE